MVVCWEFLLGMKYYPVIYGDYFTSQDPRIPLLNNQDSMEHKRFFCCGSCKIHVHNRGGSTGLCSVMISHEQPG